MLHYQIVTLCVALVVVFVDSIAGQQTDLSVNRNKFDIEFDNSLAQIASQCDSLGLDEQAAITRRWKLSRDPQRQYIFLPYNTNLQLAGDGANEDIRSWSERFNQCRRDYAEKLFELAQQAARHNPPTDHGAEVYQLLYEVLANDPGHERAREILGYWRDPKNSESWIRTRRSTRAVKARRDQSTIGWKKRSYWVVESPHFEIHSAADQTDALELAEKLERWYWVWKQVFFDYWSSSKALKGWFEGKSSDRSGSRRHKVILFRNREQYLADLSDVSGIEKSTGYYQEKNRTSFFYVDSPAPLNTWRHELVHQLFQENKGRANSVRQDRHAWLIEGIAMYFESMDEHGHFVTLGGFDAPRLQYARLRFKREGFFVPLAQLDAMGREELQQDANVGKLYSQAAGMSQFLMTDQQGKHRSQFIEFIKLFYIGRAKAESLSKLTTTPLDQLDRQYQKFLEVRKESIVHHFECTDQQSFSLGRCGLTGKELQRVARCKKLRWLELSGNPEIGDQDLAYLEGLKDLTQLFLDLTDVTDAGIPSIIKLDSLQEIDLGGTAVGDDGLKLLSTLTSLEVLWLANSKVTDRGITHLQELPNLRLVDLRKTQTTQAGIEQLKRERPELKVLH